MRIAIVGCGALGSYYGACLARQGLEVHFLLRSDFETVRDHGVVIHRPAGDFQVRPRVARDPAEIGPVDLVLIGLKTTANDAFPRLLPPLVGPETLLLTLQNGLGNEEALARHFPAGRILGGLCFVCLNRREPGVIQHLAHGRILLGEYRRRPGPRTDALAGMFRQAGVPCDLADDLDLAHWQKLVWNIPFNGLGVAAAAGRLAMDTGRVDPEAGLGPCLATDRLLADPGWSALVGELMAEVMAAARAGGWPLDPAYADFEVRRTREMGSYRASTLVDFEMGRPLELDSLFREPLRRGREAGAVLPRLGCLCAVLGALDARRGGQFGG
ncbi:MAG: 2-dehydropantoate 2-reductase [Verrucomicrobiota bacterium]